MVRTVLVPVDGSSLSRKALRHALTAVRDASITVLHVVDIFEPGYGAGTGVETPYEPLMGTDAWYERAEEVSDEVLSEAQDLAADYDSEVDTASDIGDPERVVVDYATEEDVDHIVLGAHGRREADRPLFGSVAETVARRARVPVTLIR